MSASSKAKAGNVDLGTIVKGFEDRPPDGGYPLVHHAGLRRQHLQVGSRRSYPRSGQEMCALPVAESWTGAGSWSP